MDGPYSVIGALNANLPFTSAGGSLAGQMNVAAPMENNNIQANYGTGFDLGYALTFDVDTQKAASQALDAYSNAYQNYYNSMNAIATGGMAAQY